MQGPGQQQHTYINDPENPVEMTRLTEQDRFVTTEMGGLFPELGNELPPTIMHILDIGCGPGAWVLDTAFAFPDREVVGLDVSSIMIDFARARAKSQGRENAIFIHANILDPLDFANGEFDLVNCRFAVGFLHRDKWPSVLRELGRVLRPGGTLRLTEPFSFGETNSPAWNKLAGAFYRLFDKKGYGFAKDPSELTYGIVDTLPTLLTNAGFEQIQTRTYTLDISYGTPLHNIEVKNYELLFDLMKNQFIQHGLITEQDFDSTLEQVKFEGHQEDFRGIWQHLTAWGQKAEPTPSTPPTVK